MNPPKVLGGFVVYMIGWCGIGGRWGSFWLY